MSGELRVYRDFVAFVGAERLPPMGDRNNPMKAVAIAGNPKWRDGVVVPAATEVVLWTYAAGNDFVFAAFEASGYCELRWKVDKATSASDRTPLGTHVVWMRKRISCYAPEIFQSNTALCADTPADVVAAGAGGGTVAEGYIYEFRVYNPGTASITLDRFILG